MDFTLPEMMPPIQGHEPVASNSLANTADVISCKNIHKLWTVIHHYGGGGTTDLTLTWNEALSISGSSKAIVKNCPIWSNIDTAAADLFSRATDAYAITIDCAATKDQIWIIEWDPAKFSVGYDCFQLRSASGDGSNLVQVMYFPWLRYMADVVPTIITD